MKTALWTACTNSNVAQPIKLDDIVNVVDDYYRIWQKGEDDILGSVVEVKGQKVEMNMGKIAGMIPNIKKVIYQDPATIILWQDKTKTVVKCSENDIYNQTTGLASCVLKRILGNEEYRKLLKKHLPKESAGD